MPVGESPWLPASNRTGAHLLCSASQYFHGKFDLPACMLNIKSVAESKK